MGNDGSRKAILARRARFMAAALAGVAVTAGAATTLEACGGTADDNNVWGEGLLDCLGPVREAPLP